MGTKFPTRWRSLLLPGFILLFGLASAAPALAAEDALDAPHRAGAPQVDGRLDDLYWSPTEAHTLRMDGTLAPEAARAVALRVAHNGTHLFLAISYKPGGGTHPGDFVLIDLAPDQDAAAAGQRADLLRYGWRSPTLLEDMTWDGSTWHRDVEVGCGIDGTAARTDDNGTWHYEIAKPLSGDGCDVDMRPGTTIGMRIESRENRPAPTHGDNFRWPLGSTDDDETGNRNGRLDEAAAWADLRLVAGGASEEAPADASGTLDSKDAQTARPADAQAGDETSRADGRAAQPGTNAIDGGQGTGIATGRDEGEAAEARAPMGVVTVALVLCAVAASRRPS